MMNSARFVLRPYMVNEYPHTTFLLPCDRCWMHPVIGDLMIHVFYSQDDAYATGSPVFALCERCLFDQFDLREMDEMVADDVVLELQSL